MVVTSTTSEVIVKPCSFTGCERTAKSLGLCSAHYQQSRSRAGLKPLWEASRRLPSACGFLACGRPASCKGLCDGHYQQQRAGKELAPLQVRHACCTFPGCSNPHEAKGLCEAHYTQSRIKGEVSPLTYLPSPIDAEGKVTLFGERDRVRGHAVGHATIDVASHAIVSDHRWRMSSDGYAVTKIEGKSVKMHRMLMPHAGGREVDHIDGNRLNNCLNNLRLVTDTEQSQNRGVRSDSKTGHRNVHFDPKKGLYRVIVTAPDGRRHGHRHKNLQDALDEAASLRAMHHTHASDARASR